MGRSFQSQADLGLVYRRLGTIQNVEAMFLQCEENESAAATPSLLPPPGSPPAHFAVLQQVKWGFVRRYWRHAWRAWLRTFIGVSSNLIPFKHCHASRKSLRIFLYLCSTFYDCHRVYNRLITLRHSLVQSSSYEDCLLKVSVTGGFDCWSVLPNCGRGVLGTHFGERPINSNKPRIENVLEWSTCMSFQIDTMNKIFKCVNVYLIKDVIRLQCSDLVPAASNAEFLGCLLRVENLLQNS